MTAAEVKAKILAETGGRHHFEYAPTIDLRASLVEPELREYLNIDTNIPEMLWHVFEEEPKEKKGYSIVFDENADAFGLAVRDIKNGVDVCLGCDGTFLQTLESM